jgi:hypothetical protein
MGVNNVMGMIKEVLCLEHSSLGGFILEEASAQEWIPS